MLLSDMLAQFWLWLGVTPDEYASCFDRQYDEYMFPFWDLIIGETCRLIDCSDYSSIDNILTVMAIDNETEDILDYLATHAEQSFLNKMVLCLPNHIQPNARWQGAELIRRRAPSEGVQILTILQSDENAYVSRRATISREYITRGRKTR